MVTFIWLEYPNQWCKVSKSSFPYDLFVVRYEKRWSHRFHTRSRYMSSIHMAMLEFRKSLYWVPTFEGGLRQFGTALPLNVSCFVFFRNISWTTTHSPLYTNLTCVCLPIVYPTITWKNLNKRYLQLQLRNLTITNTYNYTFS